MLHAPERAYVESITLPTDRRRLLDRAACAAITVPFVRSHETAALELEMGILLPVKAQTHVTRQPVVGSHNKWGVKHHLAPYSDGQVVQANGFDVLGLARTAIDIAREHGRPYGVIAVDSRRSPDRTGPTASISACHGSDGTIFSAGNATTSRTA